MDGILDFFSPQAGQARRRRLDELAAGATYYIPPELRGLLGLVAEANPVRGMERAGVAAGEIVAPDATGLERVGAGGRMLSEMAGVLAPAAVAGRVGMPAAEAIQEGLLGVSAGARDVGRAVAERLNQPGPMPTLYSNPVPGLMDKGDIVSARGAQIVDMLRSGRASEISDEMLDMGDPVLNTRLNEYLYFNYDLPMDEASRMARAAEMGPFYHGSATDFPYFDMASRGQVTNARTARMATWAVDNPDVAGQYARLAEGGPVQKLIQASYRAEADGDYDLAEDLMRQAEELELSGNAGAGGNVMPLMVGGRRLVFDAEGEKYDATDYVLLDKLKEAQRQNYGGVQIENFVDNPDYSDFTEATHVGIFDPRNIRSRFARFDPRLRHLRNLSAGVGGLGLLAYGEEEQ